MANPNPENAVKPAPAVNHPATSVDTVAHEIVQEEAAAKQDYVAAQPAAASVEQDLSPVLGGEPAIVLGAIVAIIIAVLALTGVIDVSTSVGVVTSAAPFISGIVTRFFVSPTSK